MQTDIGTASCSFEIPRPATEEFFEAYCDEKDVWIGFMMDDLFGWPLDFSASFLAGRPKQATVRVLEEGGDLYEGTLYEGTMSFQYDDVPDDACGMPAGKLPLLRQGPTRENAATGSP